MITLITGLPGASKTLNTLELVEKECANRQIFYNGIEELTLPWTHIDIDDFHKWFEDFPDGSVFVIDEVQRTWPGIAHTKNSPDSVTHLDTHRHRGFDFYLITQNPILIDHRARKFVGRHIHFERAMGLNMARRVEFQEVANDPRDYHARQRAVITNKRFNKKYFGTYKSASVHTVKRRVPPKVWAAVFLPLLVLGAALHFAGGLGEGAEPESVVYSDLIPDSSPFSMSDAQESPDDYLARFQPRVAGVPHSAPAYDEVTVVKTYPRPQCIHSPKLGRCSCYTQQATPLDIPFEMCLHYVRHGWFDPYRDEEKERVQQDRRERDRKKALAASDPSDTGPEFRRIVIIPDGTQYPSRGPSS